MELIREIVITFRPLFLGLCLCALVVAFWAHVEPGLEEKMAAAENSLELEALEQRARHMAQQGFVEGASDGMVIGMACECHRYGPFSYWFLREYSVEECIFIRAELHSRALSLQECP